MTAEEIGIQEERRILRCAPCRAKIPVQAEQAVLDCPTCGLALLKPPGMEALHPMVVPRASRESSWQALVSERRLPDRASATELRRARLLLVPFWHLVDESRRSISRRGVLVSAADLLPIGLPRITATRQRIAGLDVEASARTGDAMGRFAGESPSLDAVAVDVALGPNGLSLRQALEASVADPASAADPASPRWRLVYYPIWSFHYVVFNKEHYHVVDAVTGRPIGPARRLRWHGVAATAAAAMLLLFLAGSYFMGPGAAFLAWAGALCAMRLEIRRQRS